MSRTARRAQRRHVPVALAAICLALPVTLRAQEAPKNLQVLPKDMPRSQVTQIMCGFTRALGVRCSTCHVGEEGQPLSTYDFASDDKGMKLKAREMLRMVGAINGTDADAARRVLEMNLEFYPNSAFTLFALAQIHADAGDKDRAIELYKRGLEIMPDNPQAQRRLRELTGGL